ncbi:MAG: glucokinase [Erythrobacter sp.]
MTRSFAVADIGGTNARFARATVRDDGSIELDEPSLLATDDHPSLADAWRAFLARHPDFDPEGAALALAGPVGKGRFKLTNADWAFDTTTVADELGLSRAMLINDFEAVAHAIAGDPDADHIEHLAGPQRPLPESERVTVVGPGTGLGIAHYRVHEGRAYIQPTEGAHIDFAPTCALDDAVLALLRQEHDRVSVERVISGDGIRWIDAALRGKPPALDPLPIWQAGMAGEDPEAARAVDHFVAILGRVAGDYALSHGSAGVVIAGGLGLRLREKLSHPGFHEAFMAKGRFRRMMEDIPVKLIGHDQPGLLGAARAFLARR